MNNDPRESYENENLDESKLDRWYGTPYSGSLVFGLITSVLIILAVIGVYFVFN